MAAAGRSELFALARQLQHCVSRLRVLVPLGDPMERRRLENELTMLEYTIATVTDDLMERQIAKR